jgi:hypothetical protein
VCGEGKFGVRWVVVMGRVVGEVVVCW